MAKRRKAAAVEAPQTRGEAIALAQLYVEAERTASWSQQLLDDQIAKAKADHARRMENIEPHLQHAFTGLRAWWAANSAELTKGKRRSIELGPVTLGERTGMPKLKLPKGMNAEAALAWLKGLRWKGARGFIRTKEELDKEAVIKALRAPADAPQYAQAARKLFSDGEFKVVQAEEFFIRTGEPESPIDMESQTWPTS
ncbi:phage host-nuclease inhibitor protein Gam [Blastomonas natatoria]|uniref:Phage host-nuclease inhibitor protein Gam n=1 Tax=Blastomonas natatoria TaxID=34015 RepID=A0A2V3VCT6_9SPHN|nr:host-nuclease inhibitor Gam family protein [Blastomonas natatoria]PXW78984.1 phage host-nuclease inhibitor protein Gam [Blastomonas natatoria]